MDASVVVDSAEKVNGFLITVLGAFEAFAGQFLNFYSLHASK